MTPPRGLITRLSGIERIRTALAPASTERVLPSYQSRGQESLTASLLIALAIVYACLSGYFLGVFQQFILQQFLAPCLLLAALGLWALPDRTGVSHTFLERGFFALVISNVIWPVYLAIAVPGLPWITLSKLVLLATLLGFGIVLATDRDARASLKAVFDASRTVKICLATFVAVQFLTIPLSIDVRSSMDAVINAQFYWTGSLLMASLVLIKPGRIDTLGKCLLVAAGILSVIAVWELRIERLPWVGHIPSFLKVNDPIAQQMLAGGRRATDGLYRIQTTYTTSLSSAEFMAMAMPFIIHYFLTTRKLWLRIVLALIYVGVIVTIYGSRARLGMIGVGIAHLAYPLLVGLRRRALMRNDLVGPSMIALYPAMLAGFMGLLLASRRLYIMFIGGGQHQASNDARASMFERGIPMILQNPWGFGADKGPVALGYRLPNGMLTIDSYYLSIGLDYGVIGFVAFYTMILTAIYLCVRVYLTVADDEAKFAAPIGVTLGAYLVIKSVLSQPQNQWLLYILIGAALTLNYRFGPRKALKPRMVQ